LIPPGTKSLQKSLRRTQAKGNFLLLSKLKWRDRKELQAGFERASGNQVTDVENCSNKLMFHG